MNDLSKDTVYSPMAGEAMLSRLAWMTLQPKVVLVVGDQSAGLRERYPDAKFVVVGAEAETLSLADHSVDLIFANFILPWHRDIKSLLNEWRRVLSIDGLLMLSALGLDTLSGSQVAPVLVDMHDIGDALVQAGFVDPVLDVDYYQIRYRDAVQLSQELIAAGMWSEAQSILPGEDGTWLLTFEMIYAHAFGPQEKESGIVKIPLSSLRRQLRG